jgi:hypothetical protein
MGAKALSVPENDREQFSDTGNSSASFEPGTVGACIGIKVVLEVTHPLTTQNS